jgi:hypothetical protein
MSDLCKTLRAMAAEQRYMSHGLDADWIAIAADEIDRLTAEVERWRTDFNRHFLILADEEEELPW